MNKFFLIITLILFISCASTKHKNQEECQGRLNRYAHLALELLENEGNLFKISKKLRKSNYIIFEEQLRSINYKSDLSEIDFRSLLLQVDRQPIPICDFVNQYFMKKEKASSQKVIFFSNYYDNMLIAEIFDVDYLEFQESLSYSGKSQVYLFIFKNGGITKVFNDRLTYN